MSQKTIFIAKKGIKALDASIKTWAGVVFQHRGRLVNPALPPVRHYGKDCPLCNAYANLNEVGIVVSKCEPCKGCPIMKDTGVDQCTETVYDDWRMQAHFDNNDRAALPIAQEMLRYLRDLRTRCQPKVKINHRSKLIASQSLYGMEMPPIKEFGQPAPVYFHKQSDAEMKKAINIVLGLPPAA